MGDLDHGYGALDVVNHIDDSVIPPPDPESIVATRELLRSDGSGIVCEGRDAVDDPATIGLGADSLV